MASEALKDGRPSTRYNLARCNQDVETRRLSCHEPLLGGAFGTKVMHTKYMFFSRKKVDENIMWGIYL